MRPELVVDETTGPFRQNCEQEHVMGKGNNSKQNDKKNKKVKKEVKSATTSSTDRKR